jgi:hypothetical protein
MDLAYQSLWLQEHRMNEPQTPMGTLALMFVLILLTVALWVNAYLTVISRGTTQ